MKIKILTRSDKSLENHDYQDIVEIYFNNKVVFRAHDGEYEDNTLGRNFSGCYSIPKLLKMAYIAGKNGEEFELEEGKTEE